MSIYSSRQVGRFGAFGSAFGGLEVFSGGPSFEGGDSYNIFFDSGASRWAEGAKAYGITWAPPSTSIIRAAGQVWANIDAVGSEADVAFKEKTAAEMARLTKSIDQLAGSHDVFGYNQSVTTQLAARMKELKTSVQRVAAYQVTPTEAPPALTTRPSSSSGAATAAGRGSDLPTVGGLDDGGFPWLYVGLGVGALLLLGGGYVLLKPSKMSGYRRRRRRR